jgi:hypothetical protein
VRRAAFLVPIATFALLLVAGVRAASAAPVDFTLTVTPQTGSLDDDFVATLQIAITGVNGAERVWEPDWGDFQVMDRRNQQSSQWSYDPQRGQEIRSVEMRRYLLKARRAGKLRIGEAKVRVNGKEYTTRPLVVEVLPSGQAPSGGTPDPTTPQYAPPDPSMATNTFLHVVVDKPRLRVGEQATVTWIAYTRAEILRYEPKLPRFDDFWVETIYEPQAYLQYGEDVVGGRTYKTAVLSRKALFPTRAGKVTVPPLRVDMQTTGNPFGAPLKLASKELTLEVEALPPGAPPGFDPGLVGQWTAEASIDRDNLPAGESLELTLTLRGEGAIRRSKVPRLSIPGFEVFAPLDFSEKVETSGDVIRGERKFAYVLSPQKGGTLPIGPLEISYFNSATGRYDSARTDLLSVKVVGDPGTLAGASADSEDNVITREIRPPHEIGTLAPRFFDDFHRSRLFLVALLAPGLAFLGVVFLDVVRERLHRETPRARLRRARGRARRRQKMAEVHIRGNRPRKFFDEMARMLSEHIEERIGQPVAALTRDQLGRLLDERGFPPELVQELIGELERCDFARFAPSAAGPGEMKSALRRAQDLLRAIEKVRPLAEDEVNA